MRKNIGEKFLAPLNVQKELIHSYSLSFVYIIVSRFPKSIIWECGLSTIRSVMAFNLPQANWLTWLKNVQPSFLRKDGLIGQVTICNRQQPICIPGNSTIIILGYTNKLPPRTTCLMEQVEHIYHLALWLIGAWLFLKARAILIIIINTNKYNVWVRHPLLAAQLYDAECNQIEYRATMDTKNGFQPVLPQLIDINRYHVESGPVQSTSPNIIRPEFGPRPNTGLQILTSNLRSFGCLFNLILEKKPI